ncbi:MAG: recombinase family protein [Bacillales bacterium]|jgi:DNA invertase Pin-like site-specific DNA recombinase|nr:recombinase family protein [Bacillales bacterium]
MNKTFTTCPAIVSDDIKRVVIYARVSKTIDDQDSSYELQIDELRKQVESNPKYKLVCIYADKSSETGVKREGFQAMLELAKYGGFDVILTKSISRFARNITDALTTISSLKTLGIEVIFDSENISTFDPSSDFVLSVLAGCAEDISVSLSQNIRWTFDKLMRKGEFCDSRLYGYRIVNKKYVIYEEEAKVIKTIYSLFLAYWKMTRIIEFLHERNIKSPSGKEYWGSTTIESILRNEKYCGDMLTQKSYSSKILGVGRKKNTGELNQYYESKHHTGIISKKTFDNVQYLKRIRNRNPNGNTTTKNNESSYFHSNVYNKDYRYKSEKHNNKKKPVLFLVSEGKRHMIHYQVIIDIALDCSRYLYFNMNHVSDYLLRIPLFQIDIDKSNEELYSSLENIDTESKLIAYQTISNNLCLNAMYQNQDRLERKIIKQLEGVLQFKDIDRIKELFTSYIIEDNEALIFISLNGSSLNTGTTPTLIHHQTIKIIRNYKQIDFDYSLFIS